MDRTNISQTIQPMTISMIKKGMKSTLHTQLDYVINEGHPINTILIVGFSVELLINSDLQEFQALIEDSTGNIQVITPLTQQYPYWLDKLIQENPKQPSYVRCIIIPKQFKQEIVFQCVYMELIKNFNIITLHLIDCIKAYEYRKSISYLTQLDNNQEQQQLIKTKSLQYQSSSILQLIEKQPLSKDKILELTNISEQLFQQCLQFLADQIQLNENDEYYKLQQ
ncbi:unnamed protein product [Paramecium pentaurelia]|uniref:Uncharacterized protein n=1 Tax=Paramecium pentaurelia TaxID=43138 RepID=A0A8S1U5A8_9CILI|nr:unnamed protein product [Paramecium pentaurelia]